MNKFNDVSHSERPKIAITGANGMLGTALLDVFSKGYEVFANSRRSGYQKEHIHWQLFDLTDIPSLENWLKSIKPEIVIHCAALTNVDECEEKFELAKKIHAEVPNVINNIISKWDGLFVYISTDAVFDGKKIGPYIEEDETHPLNAYGVTKRLGELNALNYSHTLVLRTTIFGWSFFEKCSFAEWILKGLIEKTKLTMFTDVQFTPIHVSNLSQIILKLVQKKSRGLFHVSGKDSLSKYHFSLKLAQTFGLGTENIVTCKLKDIPLKAPRAQNMSLSSQKLIDIGIFPPAVEAGLLLLKEQFEEGWLSEIKDRKLGENYRFWEAA